MSDNKYDGTANTRDTDTDFQNKNYPSEYDSTAEGGYGSSKNPWADVAQRGHPERADNNANGLIDQSLNGGPIGQEIQDAKQGGDASTREEYAHEAQRDFSPRNAHVALDPYGRNPDTREEVAQMLASSYADNRGRKYESGPAAGPNQDCGLD